MDAAPKPPTGSLRDRLQELRLRRSHQPPLPQTTLPKLPQPQHDPSQLALPGEVSRIENAGGTCWHWKTLASQVCPELDLNQQNLHRSRRWNGPDRRAIVTAPTDAFVFDLETGGLSSSTQVFLIGVLAVDEWPLCVHQWLATDYPEEAAVVQGFADWIGEKKTWISFNGKSYDEPFVRDRGMLLRVALPEALAHFDLLHAARKRWKHDLPNCRLQTLEKHILKRERVGDVPSRDVPDLFHFACRSGNLRPLTGVLLHNQIDLVSCLELYRHLSAEV